MSIEIRSLSLVELSAQLTSGSLSSVEVTDAYLARIDAVQERIHPAAMILADSARAQARDSDARRKSGTALGALDGIPLSLKENLDLVGTASTLGLPSRTNHQPKADAVVVSLLRQTGAVFTMKSNVSQALLFHESRNPIYGETGNPFDVTRSPGGSSGGEGAALACGASVAGVGTDIGGSIRVPATWCGVAGLKPTVDRLSNIGSSGAIPGQEVIRGQLGPMARSSRDVAFLFEHMNPLGHHHRDPRVPPLPVLQSVGDKPHGVVGRVRVGFYLEDPMVKASSSVMRAVQIAARALADAGCDVVPWTPPRFEEALFTYMQALSADGARTLKAQLSSAELDPALQLLWRMTQMPKPALTAIAAISRSRGDAMAAMLVTAVGEKSVQTLWQLTRRAREIAHDTFTSLDNIDVVLCPAHATPAIQSGTSKDFSLGGASSMYFNLVNFPGGVVPVTTVMTTDTPRIRGDTRLDKRATAVDEGSMGLPVGVQVVAKPWREDIVLWAMQVIERGVCNDDGFPVLPLS
jgi:fatty acid amide hydrolase